MFYNHADETERRHRRSLQLEARGFDVGHRFRSAGAALGQQGPSSASPEPVPIGSGRRSPSELRPTNTTTTTVFSTYDNNNGAANVSSSHNRPALWPPSHTEIVEGLHREGLLENEAGVNATNKIPAWYRGPLLLAGNDNHDVSSASASGAGFPLAASSSSWSKSFRSASEDAEGRRGRAGAVRTQKGSCYGVATAAAPAAGDGENRNKRRKKVSGSTTTKSAATAAAGEVQRGEVEVGVPTANDVELFESKRDAEGLQTSGRRYNVHEEEAIRKIISKFEDGSKEAPLATYSNFTTENWIEHVCEPAIEELENNEAYMSMGMNPRKRFSCEAGVYNLRRWVSDQELRSMNASSCVKHPTTAEAKALGLPGHPEGGDGIETESRDVGGKRSFDVSSSVMGFLNSTCRGFGSVSNLPAVADGNHDSDPVGVTVDRNAMPNIGQFGANTLGSCVDVQTTCLHDASRGGDTPGSSVSTPGPVNNAPARGQGRFGFNQFGTCVGTQSSNQDGSSSSATSTSMSDGTHSRSSATWRNNVGYPAHDSMGSRYGSSRVVVEQRRNKRDRRGYENGQSILGGSTTSGSTMSRLRSYGDGSTCSSSSWNPSRNSSQWDGSATSGKYNNFGFPSVPREKCPEGGLYGGVPRSYSSRDRIHFAIAGVGEPAGSRGGGRVETEPVTLPEPGPTWGIPGSSCLPSSSSTIASTLRRDNVVVRRNSGPVVDHSNGGSTSENGTTRGIDSRDGGSRVSFGSGSEEGRRRDRRSGRRIMDPTPPRSRRRSPAVRVRARPLVCAATPAEVAAAEADRLNNLPRPPRPLRPSRLPPSTVGDGRHRNAISLAITTAKSTMSAMVTTQSTAAKPTGTAASEPSPPRESLTVGLENSKRRTPSRGAASEKAEAGGSEKVGPRHPSNGPRKILPAAIGETPDSSPNVAVVEATASRTTKAATNTRKEDERGSDDDSGGRMRDKMGTAFASAPRAVPLVARATHVAVLESDGRIGGIRERAVSGNGGETSGSPGGVEASPTTLLWKGEGREAPSLASRLMFAAFDPIKRYRHLHLAVWLLSMGVMVADRLLWNVWPRQSFGGAFCQDDQCGEDFFCPMHQAPGCLMEGPGSVKAFDWIARVTGRVIIAATNLSLVTSCIGTWSWLSETERLHKLLRGWRADNDFLRAVGFWTLVVAVVAHVYVLLLPPVFGGFGSESQSAAGVSWPAQLVPAESIPLVDVDTETVTWEPDDLVSVFWVSVILTLSAMLLLRSRSLPSMVDYSAMYWWLTAVTGTAIVFESVRRRSHPHVWVLNGPVLLLYAMDCLFCRYIHRAKNPVNVTCVRLGADHDLLLWFAPPSGYAGLTDGQRTRVIQTSIIGDVVEVHPVAGVTWGYSVTSSAAVFSSLSLPTIVQDAIDTASDPAAAAVITTKTGDNGTLSTADVITAPEKRQSGNGGSGPITKGEEEWAFGEGKVADQDSTAHAAAATRGHGWATARKKGDCLHAPFSQGQTSAISLFDEVERNDQGYAVGIDYDRERLAADVGTDQERVIGPYASQWLGSPLSTIGSASTADRASIGISSPPSLLRGRRWGNRPADSSGADDSLLGRTLSLENSEASCIAGNESILVGAFLESSPQPPSSDTDTESFTQTESIVGSTTDGSVCSSSAGRVRAGRKSPRWRDDQGVDDQQHRRGLQVLEPLAVVSSPLPDAKTDKGDERGFDGGVFGGVVPKGSGGSHHAVARVRTEHTADGGAGEGGSKKGLQARQGAFVSGQREGLTRSISTTSSALGGGGSYGGSQLIPGEAYSNDTYLIGEEEGGGEEKRRDKPGTVSSSGHPSVTRPGVDVVVSGATRPRSYGNASNFDGNTAVNNASYANEKHPVGCSTNDAGQHFKRADWEVDGRDYRGEDEGDGEGDQCVVHNGTMWAGLGEGARMMAVDAAADVDDVAVTMQVVVVVPLEPEEQQQTGVTSGAVEKDEGSVVASLEGGDMRAGLRETTACMSGATYFSVIAAECSRGSGMDTSDFDPQANGTRGNAINGTTTAAGTGTAAEAPPTTRDVAYLTVCSPPAVSSVDGGSDSFAGGGHSSSPISTAGRQTATWNRMTIVRVAPVKTKGAKWFEKKESTSKNPDAKGPCLSTATIQTQNSEASMLEEGTLLGVASLVGSPSGLTTVRSDRATTMSMDMTGPYRSVLVGLMDFPVLPPLLVVATGAGAGLVLEFLAHVSRTGEAPANPVTVCYASDNAPLLRFVTNELLARKPPGVRVASELLLPNAGGDEKTKKKVDRGRPEGLMQGRLNLEGFLEKTPIDTQVYFCGEHQFDQAMRAACARMCLAYAGACID